jgi:hypothetical protein
MRCVARRLLPGVAARVQLVDKDDPLVGVEDLPLTPR